jgi:hypothetical protein
MNPRLLVKPALITAFSAATLLLLASWQQAPPAPPAPAVPLADTTPRHMNKVKDIDQALEELERGMQQVEKELKKPLPPIPPIEPDKIKVDIENSLQKVDFTQMEAELKASMKRLEADLAKAKVDMEKGLKEIDAAKIKADVQASIAKVDAEKMRREVDKIKQTDFKKMEEDLAKIGPQVEQSLKEAKESMAQAKKELTAYKAFIDDLDKDGLIDKEKPYTIEIQNDQLTINGKVQPAEVNNKYRTFLDAHKKLTVRKTADDFNIQKE